MVLIGLHFISWKKAAHVCIAYRFLEFRHGDGDAEGEEVKGMGGEGMVEDMGTGRCVEGLGWG